MRITITDVNDNVPQFGSASYTARFEEDIAAGTEVFTVSFSKNMARLPIIYIINVTVFIILGNGE